MNDRFQIVGARPLPEAAPTKNRHSLRGKPVASAMILSLIVLGCLFCELIMTKDPTYLDLAHCSAVPCREFLFGTDTMGRDIFSMIWYGGRLSLFIGVGSTVISTLLAILFGAVSGLAPKWLDALLMRLTEILLSVPNLLLVIFLQAVIGTPSAWSIALVIGLTSWTSIAKVVRTEVRQLRASEYVIAAKCMGGSFFHILRCHLAPNFFSSILFMVVMNVLRYAINVDISSWHKLVWVKIKRKIKNPFLLFCLLSQINSVLFFLMAFIQLICHARCRKKKNKCGAKLNISHLFISLLRGQANRRLHQPHRWVQVRIARAVQARARPAAAAGQHAQVLALVLRRDDKAYCRAAACARPHMHAAGGCGVFVVVRPHLLAGKASDGRQGQGDGGNGGMNGGYAHGVLL